VNWYALFHRPGPALNGAVIFEHPAFAEHLAFLRRLQAAGMLVAAGPLPDEPGAGMAIVRVTDGVDVTALATADDLSVASGHLTVEVRAWDVRFEG
jgi:uncharacterized protein YciI